MLPLLGVAIALAFLVGPAFVHSYEVWDADEEFSYGFFIVPVTLALIWWRFGAFRRSAGRGAPAGLLLVLGALAVYLVAQRVGINAVAGWAVVPLLWGVVVFLWGWAAGRGLAFPIGFLAFGLGVYRGLLDTLGFALQKITAYGAAAMGQALGVAVARDGLTLKGANFEFIVAQACSGMSSLLSLLALASLWIYFARGTLPARVAIILSVLPLVIVANTTRVAIVVFVASHFGQEAAEGFFHGASSLVLFGLALGGLLAVSKIAGCRVPDFAA
jgi:exosortase